MSCVADRERPERVVMFGSDVVAESLASNLSGVQNRLDPSIISEVLIARDEVDVNEYPPTLLPISSCPYMGADERPVPPLATESVPVQEGVKVCTFPDDVIVRPIFVSDVVASVWAAPVCCELNCVPSEVSAVTK